MQDLNIFDYKSYDKLNLKRIFQGFVKKEQYSNSRNEKGPIFKNYLRFSNKPQFNLF